jgi:hypothetical protein
MLQQLQSLACNHVLNQQTARIQSVLACWRCLCRRLGWLSVLAVINRVCAGAIDCGPWEWFAPLLGPLLSAVAAREHVEANRSRMYRQLLVPPLVWALVMMRMMLLLGPG